MTPAQRSRFYFPTWSGALKALSARVPMAPYIAELHAHIEELAHTRAGAHDLTNDDLRHACHILAIGRDKSANDLTNDECERVVALFRLLANPDDLGAMMAWQSPDEARRKRILWWIRRKCVESYVIAVCREKFGKNDPHHLDFRQLQQLHMTLRNRHRAHKSPPSPQSLPS